MLGFSNFKLDFADAELRSTESDVLLYFTPLNPSVSYLDNSSLKFAVPYFHSEVAIAMTGREIKTGTQPVITVCGFRVGTYNNPYIYMA